MPKGKPSPRLVLLVLGCFEHGLGFRILEIRTFGKRSRHETRTN
jgi:hypothetical protein